jgi:hypothetical protein
MSIWREEGRGEWRGSMEECNECVKYIAWE